METTTDFAVSKWTANRLASEADCASPDSPTSAGARMLESVRDAVVEWWEYDEDDHTEAAFGDANSEIADGGPDIYTHTMWAEFLDLAAYNEDPTDLGFDGSDMDQGARICLYMISERCAWACFRAMVEEASGQDDE